MVKFKKYASFIYILLVLLLIYAPILLLVVYSFTDTTLIGEWNGFSFALYGKLFQDEAVMDAVKNTAILAITASVLSTVLGTAGAIGIFYSKKRPSAILNGISQVPVINSEVVTGISLAIVFAFAFGGRSYISLVVGHMVICTPFVVLSVIPKLKQMDPNIYEAALDLGASPTRALFKVVLPEIMPGIASGFLLSITLSLDDYFITAFTKPSTLRTISTYVFEQTRRPLPPTLRALSALIFLIILVGVIIVNIKRKSNSQNGGAKK